MQPFLDHQATKRVGVLVDPVDIATWDHRKLAAATG
jgi:hypothetical protein